MRSGLGKMNSDTLNTVQMVCHSAKIITSNTQGAQN